MSVLHPHHTDYMDYGSLDLRLWWHSNESLFVSILQSGKKYKPSLYSDKTGNLLIYPAYFALMEETMNGRKSKSVGTKPQNSDGQSAAIRWVNHTLTSEDIDQLEQETASLEQLSYALIELGERGLGISVKYDLARKSFSVSIYGSDTTNNMRPCGVSGQSSELRDAILVSLFKFNNCLQGSFDGCADPDTVVQPIRFR